MFGGATDDALSKFFAGLDSNDRERLHDAALAWYDDNVIADNFVERGIVATMRVLFSKGINRWLSKFQG